MRILLNILYQNKHLYYLQILNIVIQFSYSLRYNIDRDCKSQCRVNNDHYYSHEKAMFMIPDIK